MSKYSIASQNKSVDILTITDIIKAKSDWEYKNIHVPEVIKMHPELYRKLHKDMGVEKLTMQTFYGMKVEVDPDLKPGEWYFKAAGVGSHTDSRANIKPKSKLAPKATHKD